MPCVNWSLCLLALLHVFVGCDRQRPESKIQATTSAAEPKDDDAWTLEINQEKLDYACANCKRLEIVVSGDYQGRFKRIGPIVVTDKPVVDAIISALRQSTNKRRHRGGQFITSNEQWITVVGDHTDCVFHTIAWQDGFFPSTEKIRCDVSSGFKKTVLPLVQKEIEASTSLVMDRGPPVEE